jgi:hypothetical protein
MKPLSNPLHVVLAILTLSLAVAGARPVDLSEFAGQYRGTVFLSSSGSTASGTAAVHVTVPKSGGSATFRISGSFVSGGTTILLDNTLVFLSPRTFVCTNLVFGLGFGPGLAGKFSSRPHLLKFNNPFSIGGFEGSYSGSVRAKKVGHKRELVISNLIAISGSSPITIDFVVSRHVH